MKENKVQLYSLQSAKCGLDDSFDLIEFEFHNFITPIILQLLLKHT